MKNQIIKTYKIEGMNCVSCATLIENELEEREVVDEAVCDYASSKLTVRSGREIDDTTVTKTVEQFGYRIAPL